MDTKKGKNIEDQVQTAGLPYRIRLRDGSFWPASFLHRGILCSAIMINRLHSFRFFKDSFRNA